MKIKETNKTSYISWSPSKIYPTYLACGTAAQQLDASFSTTSSLELHRLNLSNLELDFNATASIPTESRFNKLLWSNYLNNIIIGGCENGSIYLYDYESIINENKEKCLVQKLSKHTGVVAALDSNPFQNNLLASGAGSSEIFIWDLNNPTTPMTPGAKVPPLDDIQCISWNRQVQHILASTCSGKCAVWDLRKNESIIKVSDNTSKLKAKAVGWHPDYATQMCLSSEDDHTPYLQMWDLRYATSPVKVLSGHTRGILTFGWCNEDSNLLISCGKDNQILCWNPNTSPNGEVLLEIPSNQWCFDLAWCSRYPQLIATASFEALVSVYSLMGGKYDVKPETTNLILDSFGVPASAPSQQPPPTQTQIIPQLKTAPKWLKRPCGVSFGFGGKLVTFGLEQQVVPQDQQQQQPHVAPTKFQAQKINIIQVVTDSDLVQRSQQFESTLQSGQVLEYCNYKIDNAKNKFDEEIWKFILASFDASKKSKFIDLLGFSQATLSEKIQNLINENENRSPSKDNSASQLANKLSSKLNLDVPSSDSSSRPQSPSLNLAFNNQTDNLLSEALLLGRYELAIDLCMSEARYTDAILIATFAGKEIFARTQERYFKKHQTKFSKLLEGFLNQDWNLIIGNCNLNHWKEALAAILTYTEKENLFQLCKLLGSRLENDEKNQTNSLNACICYICSSNIDSFVNCWYKYKLQDNIPTHELSALLQGLVEKVMILRYSIHNVHNEYATNKMLTQQQPSGVSLTSVLIQYSKLLAEQGSFLTALNYLKDTNDQSLTLIKDRLYNALGHVIVQQYGIPRPENPFKTTQQATNKLTQHQQQQQQQQQSLAARKSAGMYAPQPVVQPSQPSFMPPTNPNLHPPNTNQWSNQPVYTPQPPPPVVAPVVMQPQVQPPLNQFVSQKPKPPTPTFPTASAPAANIYSPAAQQYQQENTQIEAKVQSYQEVKPATAWNDPPMVVQKVKAPKAPIDNTIDPTKLFQPTAAQTMPNFGPYGNTAFSQGYMSNQSMQQTNTPTMPPPPNQAVSVNQNLLNQTATNGFHYQNIPPQQINNPSPSPIPYQHPQQYPQTMPFQQQHQQQFTQQMQYQPQQPVQQQQTALSQRNSAPTPVVEKPKLPIPTEHIILQTVFDELLKKCLESSNNPANKRKLDDVANKLELLYDKLRESLLSENVIQGMHQIVKFVQSHDYQSALKLHSDLVARSNFSEICAFMPSVKVLLTSCQQLNVFYTNQ